MRSEYVSSSTCDNPPETGYEHPDNLEFHAAETRLANLDKALESAINKAMFDLELGPQDAATVAKIVDLIEF